MLLAGYTSAFYPSWLLRQLMLTPVFVLFLCLGSTPTPSPNCSKVQRLHLLIPMLRRNMFHTLKHQPPNPTERSIQHSKPSVASCLSDQATPDCGATPPALMTGMVVMAGTTPPALMAGIVTKGGFTGCHGTGAPGIAVIGYPGIMTGALGLARVGITYAPVCACVRVRGRARRGEERGHVRGEGGGQTGRKSTARENVCAHVRRPV